MLVVASPRPLYFFRAILRAPPLAARSPTQRRKKRDEPTVPRSATHPPSHRAPKKSGRRTNGGYRRGRARAPPTSGPPPPPTVARPQRPRVGMRADPRAPVCLSASLPLCFSPPFLSPSENHLLSLFCLTTASEFHRVSWMTCLDADATAPPRHLGRRDLLGANLGAAPAAAPLGRG